MKPRTIFLLVLLAAAVVEIVFGVLWLRELKEGQAAMLQTEERMTLTARLNRAEARAGAAKMRLDAALDAPLQAAGGASVSALAGRATRGPEFERRFHAALSQPAFRSKLAEAQKARLRQEYGPLFDQLKLEAERQGKFEGLLVDKQVARSEAGPLDVYDTQIQAALGERGFEAYVHYEDTARLRAAVAKIADALRATDTPLAQGTADQLVEAWYAALPPESKGHPVGLSAEMGAGLIQDYELPLLPANGEQIARGLLSPAQLKEFMHLIRAQAAQARLQAAGI